MVVSKTVAIGVTVAVIVVLLGLLLGSGERFRKLAKWWAALSLGGQLLVGGLIAFGLWLVWATYGIRLILWYWTDSGSPTTNENHALAQLGQIGDLFGGVNALFAAFAFVGVAIAAYYQHKTFVMQREQHVRQSFEPLFFQLLGAHRPPEELAPAWVEDSNPEPDIEVIWAGFPEADKPTSMAECIRALRDYVNYQARDAQKTDATGQARWIQFRSSYEAFYRFNEATLGPYFRKLYHLFKFIAYSDLSWDEKVRYANIARASLDKNELFLLLLNCGSERGGEFKPLVEAFGLLKHISISPFEGQRTIEQVLVADLYSPTATMEKSRREEYWRTCPNECPAWGPRREEPR
jgi:hypothetical protein